MAESGENKRPAVVVVCHVVVKGVLHVDKSHLEVAAVYRVFVERGPRVECNVPVEGGIEVVAVGHVLGYPTYLDIHVGAVLGVRRVGVVRHDAVVGVPVIFPCRHDVEYIGTRTGVVQDDVPHGAVGIRRLCGDEHRGDGVGVFSTFLATRCQRESQ